MDKKTALRLARIAAGELERAKKTLRSPGYPRPHYMSYLIRDEESWRVQARYGGIFADGHGRRRDCLADLRVGSYKSDQVSEGGLHDNAKEDESYSYVEIPIGERPESIRHALWRLTEARYREAVDALLRRKAHELTYLDVSREFPSFERRKGTKAQAWRPLPQVDRERWGRFVERASLVLKRYREIKNSYVEFRASHLATTFVSSEGSRIIQSMPFWGLDCYLWMLSESGDAIPWTISHFVTDPDELPDEKTFHKEIRDTVALMKKLAAAPRLRAFAGPVLLEPKPAGLLVHEAIGHRLEGNRLLSPGEGQTFRDAVGAEVLPPYLSLRDDPSLERFDGRSLVGHYAYDDEGVPGQNTRLIENGVLRRFLTSRTGIAKRHKSNGHGRSRYHQRPISRMGVTHLEVADGLDNGDLRQALIEEIRAQEVPYGVRILRASGGETSTESYNFQAFLGDINLATRVYPDGKEELIRGVNFVGTPLNAISGIVAAGNRYEVDNAYCGAESGYVPVSTISPALLVSHLELQSKSEASYTQYAMPMPWE